MTFMDYTTLKPLNHTWTTQDDLYGLHYAKTTQPYMDNSG